jgi:ATP-dependent RNA helicase RhlE
MSFEKLNLIEPLMKALKAEGYTKPTPIQEQAIPIILEKKDLLGCAQTGTGKTAAFALPILQILNEESKTMKFPRTIKTLILTPTRELAVQISESFGSYGKYTQVKHGVIFGGVSQKAQTDRLRAGIDILVATPGRLLDLMNQKYVNLQNIEIFVLDEADRMLDMGFINDINKIIAKLPVKRQTLFFSATMPPEISKLAGSLLTNPVKVAVTPVSSTVDSIKQSVYFVKKENKRSLLIHLLQDHAITSSLVFTRTKHGADKIAKEISRAGIQADAIHGNKSQNARQKALNNFKSKRIRVLVATDIAARGLDVDELSHVINFELPEVPETYVHRIGRTGRAGLSGIALSFCDEEEKILLRDIHRLISKQISVIEDHPFKIGTSSSSNRSSYQDRKYVKKTSTLNNFTRNKIQPKNNNLSSNFSVSTSNSSNRNSIEPKKNYIKTNYSASASSTSTRNKIEPKKNHIPVKYKISTSNGRNEKELTLAATRAIMLENLKSGKLL